MESTSAEPNESSNLDSVHRAQSGAGRFILTLCQLAAPVALRPPQSPQLQPYTFFMSRAYQPDGSELWFLNMGYFDTLSDAEKWAQSVRRHYPSAFATIAPVALLPAARSEALSLSPDASDPAASRASAAAPARDASLTDSQVLRILGARRAAAGQGDDHEIALLRPEDTGTREALKEAVVRGAPVSFAVQLQWSAAPIDLYRVRMLPLFKAYTLYATETRRQGRCRYFLRLGFFADPISASQVAVQVRSRFAAAAVVPILEPEIARAREAVTGTAAIPYLEQRGDGHAGSNDTPASTSQAELSGGAARGRARAAGTVRQAAEPPAARDMWTDPDPGPDSLSESGVRHLRVQVQEQLSGRWKRIRLRPSDMEQADA